MKTLIRIILLSATTTFFAKAQIWMPPSATTDADALTHSGQITIGNLGNLIGSQFEVSNNSGTIINQFIYNAAGNARLLRLKGGYFGSTNAIFQVESNTSVPGGNNLVEDNIRFKIQANGPVGVNTVTLKAVLHVTGGYFGVSKGFLVSDVGGNDAFAVDLNGNSWARKIIVTASAFPDYVFAKNYKLLSIYDVEKYILANKHLPNIKSADEYACENGVDIGEMQTKLLEKVEELTLYVIQQQKEIDALKAKLAK